MEKEKAYLRLIYIGYWPRVTAVNGSLVMMMMMMTFCFGRKRKRGVRSGPILTAASKHSAHDHQTDLTGKKKNR